MDDLKKILIVDDSEIDREILKSILEDEFELIEADNGYAALDIVLEKKEPVDAVLLDVSMPFIDGLSVLRILRERNVDDVAVFMITAEATKDNIEKASQYNIAEFIRKPFDREDILNRVRSKLGVEPKSNLTEADIDETKRYMADLERMYNSYLDLSGNNKGCDERRESFMRILLNRYFAVENKSAADSFQTDMICKAAYLCNIGNMFLQSIPQEKGAGNAITGSDISNAAAGSDESNTMDNDRYQKHTVIGADILQLNYSKHCRRFVKLCADICLNHHERYDGKGFPNGRFGNNISVYAQMCGLLERFDELFFSYSRHNALQFDYVINQLRSDDGLVSEEVLLLLEDCKADIINYYNKNYI